MLGGGLNLFSFNYGGLPSPLETARKMGYQVVQTEQELMKADKVPLLGLFSGENMKFRIDNDVNTTEPTLSEMASTALKLLIEADTEGRGVFLFVEGSNIDLAGHDNDAATQVRESWEYDDAFGEITRRVGSSGTVIALADHATGGLALGKNDPGPAYPAYQFFVRRLARAKSSIKVVNTLVLFFLVICFCLLEFEFFYCFWSNLSFRCSRQCHAFRGAICARTRCPASLVKKQRRTAIHLGIGRTNQRQRLHLVVNMGS
jgi:hypothetical protein